MYFLSDKFNFNLILDKRCSVIVEKITFFEAKELLLSAPDSIFNCLITDKLVLDSASKLFNMDLGNHKTNSLTTMHFHKGDVVIVIQWTKPSVVRYLLGYSEPPAIFYKVNIGHGDLLNA